MCKREMKTFLFKTDLAQSKRKKRVERVLRHCLAIIVVVLLCFFFSRNFSFFRYSLATLNLVESRVIGRRHAAGSGFKVLETTFGIKMELKRLIKSRVESF